MISARKPRIRDAVVAAGVVILGGAALLGVEARRAPHPKGWEAVTREPVTPPAVSGALRAPRAPASFPAPGAAAIPPPLPAPVDPADYLQNGSKEPLVPPVVEVEAELAPGSTATAEPLTPPVITVEAQPVPGSNVTLEPLDPPVIAVPPAGAATR